LIENQIVINSINFFNVNYSKIDKYWSRGGGGVVFIRQIWVRKEFCYFDITYKFVRRLALTPNLEYLVIFGMSLDWDYHELYTTSRCKLSTNLEEAFFDYKVLQITSPNLGMRRLWAWSEVGPILEVCLLDSKSALKMFLSRPVLCFFLS
jgi:hypothetical protein